MLGLWTLLFDEHDTAEHQTWKDFASEWFDRSVSEASIACFPVMDVDGDVVAAAIGTLELGVPNPQCPRGRSVRLANVITATGHRGHGYGSLLVDEVIQWARSIDADRVDLSATPDGQRIYEQAGFVVTRAPRMKLMLSGGDGPEGAAAGLLTIRQVHRTGPTRSESGTDQTEPDWDVRGRGEATPTRHDEAAPSRRGPLVTTWRRGPRAASGERGRTLVPPRNPAT